MDKSLQHLLKIRTHVRKSVRKHAKETGLKIAAAAGSSCTKAFACLRTYLRKCSLIFNRVLQRSVHQPYTKEAVTRHRHQLIRALHHEAVKLTVVIGIALICMAIEQFHLPQSSAEST